MNIYLTDSDEEAIVDFVKDHEISVTVTGKHGSNYRLSLSCNRKKAKSLT